MIVAIASSVVFKLITKFNKNNSQINNLKEQIHHTNFSSKIKSTLKNGQDKIDARMNETFEVVDSATEYAAETIEFAQPLKEQHISGGFFVKLSGARDAQKKVQEAGKSAVTAAEKLQETTDKYKNPNVE